MGTYQTGGNSIRIEKVLVIDSNGEEQPLVINGAELAIAVDWAGTSDFDELYVNFRIDGPRMRAVAGIEAYQHHYYIDKSLLRAGRGRVLYKVEKLHLGEGTYYVSASICRHMIPKGTDAILHYVEDAYKFTVKRKSLWPLSFIYDPDISASFVELPPLR
jgi:lipopolysaccharide transport system ATP-binding protein